MRDWGKELKGLLLKTVQEIDGQRGIGFFSILLFVSQLLSKKEEEVKEEIMSILKLEYKDLKNAGMIGEYKSGYEMGFSDAMETIQDFTPKKEGR